MDPNANLEEQRRIVRRMLDRAGTREELDIEDGERLAELVEALDEWLSWPTCGFKPKAWDSEEHFSRRQREKR